MAPLPHDLAEVVGAPITSALEKRGFEALTLVQSAVLDPAHEGRDLRISSQTGSGKTVAIGLLLREIVKGDAESDGKNARPRALVLTPTRELAKQVVEELSWLYAPLGITVLGTTGGGGYRDELRAFRRGPTVIVATPGRLLDHLTRGALDASNVGAVVLDEADRMLDLGFREDLEKIFSKTPDDRRTHLVSATFPPEVRALADRVQKKPIDVQGTPLGTANTDIEHVVHMVHPRERVAAIVNLLLASPGERTLVFAKTRADVAGLANELDQAGFGVGMLSGEMEQPERDRALAAFKRGAVAALVATDVAARGIDVVDITRVIHAEPPGDADAYTHRSGRTGRAGRKGTSAVLVSPSELVKTLRLLSRARVRHRIEPVPTAATIRAAEDARLYTELTEERAEEPNMRVLALAERLAASPEHTRILSRLITRAIEGSGAEARELIPIDPPSRSRIPRDRDPRDRPQRGAYPTPQGPRAGYDGPREAREPRSEAPRKPRRDVNWVPFRISWGEVHGADTRRIVAMLCRRGKIDGADVGAIRVQRTASLVEIAEPVAESFEHATKAPDPRDPKIVIRRWRD